MKARNAVLLAVLAALLYSLLMPVSKLLLLRVGPVAEAGWLYLGAGVGMSLLWLAQRGKGGSRPPVGRGDLKYVLAMVGLDMLAPILLLWGLNRSTPENVSLLNNFEIVATSVIAALFFRERISRRLALSIAVITLSCLLLSLDSPEALRFSAGSGAVLLACVCWGLENNCTSALSGRDTRQIVIIKGLGSGSASLLLSLLIGEEPAAAGACLAVMGLGFLAVGLSVYCYVLAQSRIGAARTSSWYAVAPFMGVLWSLLLFREMPGPLFWAALALMTAGVLLNLREMRESGGGSEGGAA
ncbi:MAG: DMT family transporter [Firmicutes bacterium]|nr:DMT family transporter [Bacillota bacterium]